INARCKSVKLVFFFQAEDGIRYFHVTGVQTCALPIYVVIIGGGVIGCSIAYYLAKRGARVTVLERDLFGSHASSAAAGILGAQLEMDGPGPLSELCLKSRSMFPDLASELYRLTGIDIELIRAGIMHIAWTPEEAEMLRHRGAL